MTVRITPEALDVVRRSLSLAGSPGAGVRLRLAGGEVRPRFAAEPEPGDEVVESEGVRVFVSRSILERHPDVEIAVTPEHETLVVRELTSGA